MRHGSPRRSRGFSLIELITVVVMIGIFTAMAIPGFTYLTRITRVKGAATTVYLSLLKARSEAVKRGSAVTLTPVGGNWAAGWTMTDSAARTLLQQEAFTGLTLAGPATVVYLSSGRIQGGAVLAFSVSSTQTSGSKTVARCVTASTNGSPYVKDAVCS
ncbi:MAG TPA: GspH/FimT family pseudopilin [Candidatus Binatia bacterium]|nr:GspH/FimT family pseudopilin [Candidatus Binatia bacterium]